MTVTYRFRLKDGSGDGSRRAQLRSLAGEVNFVWDYANGYIRQRWKTSRLPATRGELHALTRGSSRLLSVNSQTVQAVYEEALLRTKKAGKFLRFRTAKGGKNLGWIPFKGQTVRFHGGYVDYASLRFRLWQHRELPQGAAVKSGSFSEDSRGRWYVNLTVEIPDAEYFRENAANKQIGVDLGQKTIATTSGGMKFERDNLTKKYEEKLASAQRRGKKRQVKTLHAKIKNSRLDFSHKMTEKLAKSADLIFVGDASSRKLKKTKMAKGVSDAAWHQIKTLLAYKSIRRRGRMLEVSEKFSTVTCSVCDERSGPSGLSGLKIREWRCGKCGAAHDRDVNAAANILRLGLETLNAAEKSAA